VGALAAGLTMAPGKSTGNFFAGLITVSLLLLIPIPILAQSTAVLQGRVVDTTGAVVADSNIPLRNHEYLESNRFPRIVGVR
jgi:K+-transporting ATPase A subunit